MVGATTPDFTIRARATIICELREFKEHFSCPHLNKLEFTIFNLLNIPTRASLF